MQFLKGLFNFQSSSEFKIAIMEDTVLRVIFQSSSEFKNNQPYLVAIYDYYYFQSSSEFKPNCLSVRL